PKVKVTSRQHRKSLKALCKHKVQETQINSSHADEILNVRGPCLGLFSSPMVSCLGSDDED
ncbi:hypothetical protein OAH05_02305, partial [bacterium]|nr:hypothetical protein [bacterium]